MALIKEKEIHLNDLRFSQLCQELYGINRGVYNTIDDWFYTKGIINILERRKVILDFLASLEQSNQNIRRYRKFGHGGLSAELDSYWEETKCS
ncbi:hypothetical protein ACFSCZ_19765 [Siminovitchia sediminis]|uniref:Uncharacterized protein n=1 Tax=Siminovitchia sediminis TaxID=1274353 RepID=A0ABW4KLM5_9BACI